jgi:ADP-heptose:LPS heptosyltransferase
MNVLRVPAANVIRVLTRSFEGQSTRSKLKSARRFLFLQYETALGTAVHATPVFEALRNAVPNAVITVACNGLPFEVLKHNPSIDAIIKTPHPLKHWRQTIFFFITKLWKTRNQYDCVITDSGNRRSRFNLLSFLTGARCRIGFKTSLDLNHTSLAYDLDKSVLANNLSLIGLLGHRCTSVEPAVYFSQHELDHVGEILRRLRICEEKPLVAFQTQTSGGEPNQWYHERFVELADRFYQSTKAQLIFVGTKTENARIGRIRAAMTSPSYSAAGLTDIPGLAALLSKCDLLITLDTGTMHVGRSVNIPMVVIAPAKNPLYEWLPPARENLQVLVRKDISCACCRKTFCATRECMDEIHAGEVFKAAVAQLQKFPASSVERQNRILRRLRHFSRAAVENFTPALA